MANNQALASARARAREPLSAAWASIFRDHAREARAAILAADGDALEASSSVRERLRADTDLYSRRLRPHVLAAARDTTQIYLPDCPEAPDPAQLHAAAVNFSIARARSQADASAARLLAAEERRGDEIEAEAAMLASLESWDNSRARSAGRDIAAGIVGFMAMKTLFFGGRQYVRWATSGHSCPICLRLAARDPVPAGADFAGAGESLTDSFARRSGIKHAPAHRGCDCSIQGA